MAVLSLAPLQGAAARQDPPAGPPTTMSETTLLLDVRVNGWSIGMVGRFYEAGDAVFLPADQFEGLGFRVDEASVITVNGERRVPLASVPGLEWRIDHSGQTIDITVPFERLTPNQLRVAPPRPRTESRADWGALFTYDAFGEWSRRPDEVDFSRSLSVNLDARIFSPWFTASTSGYYSRAEGEPDEFIRLESRVDIDSTEGVWRLRLGDSFTGGPVWLRPLRFGGVQWMRDFSLRPDIVTTPVPSLDEGIGLPSTIDLFVNGVQRYSNAVDPGSVRVTDLPIVSGVNAVSLIVTDQAGRRTQVFLPLYSSPLVLAKGMSLFNFEAGVARQNYSVASADYEGDFASGAVSYGVSDQLTVTGHAGVAKDFGSLGLGATFPIADLLLFDGAVLYSDGPEGRGWAYYIAAERISQRFSFSAQYTESHGYRDLPDLFGYLSFQRKAVASVGVNLGPAGQVNVAYALQRAFDGDQSSVISGSWGVDLFRNQAHLSVTGYGDFEDDSWGAAVSISFPLGSRADAFLQRGVESGGERSSFAQLRGEAYNQRLTWELNGSEDADVERTEARADWEGRFADIHLAAADSNGAIAYQAGLAQTFVLMDSQFYTAGRVDDAFTVVEVENSPGVRVNLENRLVGRTNRRGRLFIPDLQSYTPNALSIDPLDLPPDASIGDPATLVSPREGAGLITRFPVTHARSAVVTLQMPDGSAPPVGAQVRIVGVSEPAVSGFGGEIYVRGLSEGENRLDLRWRDGGCTARFTAAVVSGSLPRLGPFTCEP